METPWRIELLGGLYVTHTDRAVAHFRTQKTAILLAYLVSHPERSHPRGLLIDLFWPDADLQAGSNSLSQALSSLRRLLEPPGTPPGSVLVTNRASVRLNPQAVTTDVAEFEAALHGAASAASDTERVEWLARAVDLYRGEFLSGYYETWVLTQREWLAESYSRALGQLVALLEARGEVSRALEYARRGVLRDPLREEGRRDLMRLYAAMGQTEAALRQFRELETLLKEALAAEPSATTQSLARRLAASHVSDGRPSSECLTQGAQAECLHHLPAPLTRFVGRDQEIAEIQQLLPGTRLLTLTGAGGCGKTRLALQVAVRSVAAYPDGVWWVELAALADPARVLPMVATALAIREDPGHPLIWTLLSSLKTKQLLLILDNCEHLLVACAQLAESLLRVCPSLQIMATSREGLRLVGEQTYRVPSLSVPDPEHLPSLEALATCEAVQLFVDRAGLSQPGFALTAANAPAVSAICRRLDGIPLAIELAAARVKVLTVEQIAVRLDDRFRLLTGGSRTALPRHQTLQASIDWSYALTSDPERALLQRLAIFAGGWTLEAAEVVCDTTSHSGPPADVSTRATHDLSVLDLLTALVEKSLAVCEEHGGAVRYRLLETVRQYAGERLEATEEVATLRRRHIRFFLGLAEAGVGWEYLEREHDNVLAAIRFAVEDGEVEVALRLGAALGEFWYLRGYYAEGRERLNALLTLPGVEAHAALWSNVLVHASELALHQGDYAAVRSLREQCLPLHRELDNQQGVVNDLLAIGDAVYCQGEYRAGTVYLEEGLALARAIGDWVNIADALTHLGEAARGGADYERAAAFYEESIAICRERGLPGVRLMFNLHNLGHVANAQGDYRRAAELFRESLALGEEKGDKGHCVHCLMGLAGAAVGEQQPERAVRLLGAATALLAAIGGAFQATDRTDYERYLAAVRTQLPVQTFADAWAAGQAMTLQEAVAFALAMPDDGISRP